MPNKARLLCLAAILAASGAAAQDRNSAPLNVIDWLDTQVALPLPVITPAPIPQAPEPGVTRTATVPEVSVTRLDGRAPRRVGLVPSNITGLPDTLWSGAQGDALARAIAATPTLRLPALQTLFYTLLLAETRPPASDAQTFDLARIDALMALGALDPALALLNQAGPDTSRAHLTRFMDMSLIAGTEAGACSIVRAKPMLSPGQADDIFCAARAGDWDTSVLLLGTARALGMMDTPTVAALERFLDPDLFEDEPPLPVPPVPNALMFRVFQANGTPIPTHIWPVVYANADLSDTAGWKAQIEAAERLARTGAVPDNRLLGLYTQRRPAASGGVWERVAALQRFETALKTNSLSAVTKTLPAAWRAARSARLAVPFANLFADGLSQMVLAGPAADIAFETVLLSSQYERATQVFPGRGLERPVLAAIASGTVPDDLSASGKPGAILAAFRDAAPDPAIIAQARQGDLGHALLRTLAMAHVGGAGDVTQLTTGLATLRALGLEDIARRTALQVLLLEDQP